MKTYIKYITTALFLCFILLGCHFHFNNLIDFGVHSLITAGNSDKPTDFLQLETYLNDNFKFKMTAVDIDGLFRRIMGQKIVRNAVKSDKDFLYDWETMCEDSFQPDTSHLDNSIFYTKRIINHAEKKSIPTLYVQLPDRDAAGDENLPYNLHNRHALDSECWFKAISEYNKCPILDLRDHRYHANEFYRTDHHWTADSVLNAHVEILKALNKEIALDGLPVLTSYDNYEKLDFPNSFLGSYGIKAGRFFAGKDDFSVYVPTFETSYVHSVLDQKHTLLAEYTGTFSNALINFEILNDSNFNNKYASYIYNSYIESIIKNKAAQNHMKVLLIGNSYARPLAAYLSTAFSELHYIDPQDLRFNTSVLEYVDAYNPDAMIILTTNNIGSLLK